MELTRDIRNAITTLVHERLPDTRDAKIVSVDIQEGDAFEDEPLLYVTVVFESASGLDPAKAVSLTRHTRDKLREASRSAPFPVYRFMSKKDAMRLSAAVG